MALCIPGQTGKEISSRFHAHEARGYITNSNEYQTNRFNSSVRRYFLLKSEQRLAYDLFQMYKKGTLINKLIIKQKAKELYCSNEVLAERDIYNHFVHYIFKIYYKERPNEYSFRILQYDEKIHVCSNEKELDDTINAIIHDYNLPKPIFSHA